MICDVLRYISIEYPVVTERLVLDSVGVPLGYLNFGEFNFCKDIPIGIPRFDTSAVRLRIVNILSGASLIPRHIGSPSFDEINSVRHQVISEMAHRYWEIEGKPDGKSEQHWFRAESDWCNALVGAWF